MDKLKPCPFCGGKADIMFYKPFDGYQGEPTICRIWCLNCRSQIEGRNFIKAIEAWNRRAEYIEREAAIKMLRGSAISKYPLPFSLGILAAADELQKMPAADVATVVHGRWVPIEYDGYADGNPVWDLWECSECREEHSGDEDTLTPYCPNCGAKMDGERREGE